MVPLFKFYKRVCRKCICLLLINNMAFTFCSIVTFIIHANKAYLNFLILVTEC